MSRLGGRKFLVAFGAIAACALRPDAAIAIASIAAAFFGVHAVQDSKWAKP